MFNFRADKTGFFVTIIMLILLGAAIVTTVALWFSGLDADTFWIVVKLVWGSWWVLCIITVLTRLAIFRSQMMRSARETKPAEERPKD